MINNLQLFIIRWTDYIQYHSWAKQPSTLRIIHLLNEDLMSFLNFWVALLFHFIFGWWCFSSLFLLSLFYFGLLFLLFSLVVLGIVIFHLRFMGILIEFISLIGINLMRPMELILFVVVFILVLLFISEVYFSVTD
jgi:hypothetical protein